MKVLLLSGVLTLLFSQSTLANVLGVNVQHFNPTANGRDFVTVNSSRVLAEGEWSFGIYGNYAQNNLLIYNVPIEDQVKIERKDYLAGADAVMAYGINKNLEFGLLVPAVIAQDVDDATYRKVFVTTGPLEVRTQLKYSLSENKNEPGFAFLGSVDLPNVKNDPFTGLAARPVMNFEFAYDVKDANTAWAMNLGYRVREPGKRPDDAPMFPLDDQIIFSWAYANNFGERRSYRWVTEFVASAPIEKKPYKNATDISSGELSLAMKGAAKKGVFYTLGGGIEAWPESMSPDFRIFAGMQFYFEPEVKYSEILVEQKSEKDDSLADTMAPFVDDTDNDGIKDSKDLCPDTPEKLKVDQQGCPSDDDADGIPNYADKCPQSEVGAVVDKKGCSVINDMDYDGVPNSKDQCPNTKTGVKVDARGCALPKNRQ